MLDCFDNYDSCFFFFPVGLYIDLINLVFFSISTFDIRSVGSKVLQKKISICFLWDHPDLMT